MPLLLLSGPASEPLTLAEAKAHMRVDHTYEDALIQSLILTSRLHVESVLGLALITQSWQLQLDAWPRTGVVELPLWPIQAVTSIRVRDASGALALVPTSDYLVDTVARPARIVPVHGGWPAPGRRIAGIEIELTAGFGVSATNVPAPIREAVLLLIAHWYEHRDPVEVGNAATRIPDVVGDLLLPFKVKRV